MGGLGTGELMIALVIILVLFGGAKLPQLAKSLGQAQKEFKSGLADGATDSSKGTSETSTDAPGPTA